MVSIVRTITNNIRQVTNATVSFIDQYKKPKVRTQDLVGRITGHMDKALTGRSINYLLGAHTREHERVFFTQVHDFSDFTALFKTGYRYGLRLPKFVKRVTAWLEEKIASGELDADIRHMYIRDSHKAEQLTIRELMAKLHQCDSNLKSGKDSSNVSEDLRWLLTNISRMIAEQRRDELLIKDGAAKLARELHNKIVFYSDFSGESKGFEKLLNTHITELKTQGLSEASIPKLLKQALQQVVDVAELTIPESASASVEAVSAYLTPVVHQMAIHKIGERLFRDLNDLLRQNYPTSLEKQSMREILQRTLDYLTTRAIAPEMIQRMLQQTLEQLADVYNLSPIKLAKVDAAQVIDYLAGANMDLSQAVTVSLPCADARKAHSMHASKSKDAILGLEFKPGHGPRFTRTSSA